MYLSLRAEFFLRVTLIKNCLRHVNHNLTGMFLNAMTSSKFVPTIRRSTRITEFSATLVDNIFTNSLRQDLDSCILIENISYHLGLPILPFVNLNHPSTTHPNNLAKRDSNDLARGKFIY